MHKRQEQLLHVGIAKKVMRQWSIENVDVNGIAISFHRKTAKKNFFQPIKDLFMICLHGILEHKNQEMKKTSWEITFNDNWKASKTIIPPSKVLTSKQFTSETGPLQTHYTEILSVNLPTVCLIIRMTLIWRIWNWIK